MSLFDDVARTITVLALLLSRGYGLLLAIPPLMKAGQGWMTRFPIALAIALPTFPLAYHTIPDTLAGGQAVFSAARELVLGALTGIFFLPLFAVPRAIGTFVDQQAGLMSIQLFDPTSAERSATIFADAFEQTALFMFVLAGGFGVLAELYAASHRFWPVASTDLPSIERVTDLATRSVGAMFDMAIRYAAPFVVTLILLEYGIGLIGRAAPQLDVLTTSVALKLVSALLLVVIVGPFFVEAFGNAFDAVRVLATRFLDPAAPQ
ncbi:EscT/YscT/HrcT family type III secretion system export apparatus protein [Burkholderia ubonensis]|uniref:EscT/YscT/HrcT family type III secretion system export apparatus protein n=1 Tax=Burkholderia ubonensis TaxID=101571 RepID=UPI00075A3BCC|nr:flagellar biosynthetic protein FliR [Burkholderia ubonensis]KVO19691.1 type III secretion protein [Burkholderia ubonensis]